MKTKLLDTWYSLCRDAARQRIFIVSLAAVCTLFYFISAVSFGGSRSNETELQNQSRYEIPIGFRAVAMQSAGPLPEMRSNDLVDVIIDSAIALERISVIDVVEQQNRQTTVVLAVPVGSAAMIANASSLGILSLVLVG